MGLGINSLGMRFWAIWLPGRVWFGWLRFTGTRVILYQQEKHAGRVGLSANFSFHPSGSKSCNSPRSWFWRTIRNPISKMWRFRGVQVARVWASSPIVNWSEGILVH
jgi:hypothetical protein